MVLVGHSYSGPVITYASSKAANIQALVFVASFGLDQGATTLGRRGDCRPRTSTRRCSPGATPPAGKPGGHGVLHPARQVPRRLRRQPASRRSSRAGGQPAAGRRHRVRRAAGRGARLEEGPQLVHRRQERPRHQPDSERAAAERMGSTTVQIDGGSHAIALSQPDRASTAAVITERVVAGLAPARCCGHGQLGGSLPRAHWPRPGGC